MTDEERLYDGFDVITVDDQMIEDIFSLDKKLRYYGFRPVGVIVSYDTRPHER